MHVHHACSAAWIGSWVLEAWKHDDAHPDLFASEATQTMDMWEICPEFCSICFRAYLRFYDEMILSFCESCATWPFFCVCFWCNVRFDKGSKASFVYLTIALINCTLSWRYSLRFFIYDVSDRCTKLFLNKVQSSGRQVIKSRGVLHNMDVKSLLTCNCTGSSASYRNESSVLPKGDNVRCVPLQVAFLRVVSIYECPTN